MRIHLNGLNGVPCHCVCTFNECRMYSYYEALLFLKCANTPDILETLFIGQAKVVYDGSEGSG